MVLILCYFLVDQPQSWDVDLRALSSLGAFEGDLEELQSIFLRLDVRFILFLGRGLGRCGWGCECADEAASEDRKNDQIHVFVLKINFNQFFSQKIC